MGELGQMVDRWRDHRAVYGPRPSVSWIGERVGVRSRSTVGPWLTGESMPSPQHLRRLADLIGVSYRRVLDAALLDAGYLEEREYRGDTTPIGAGVTEVALGAGEAVVQDPELPTEEQTPHTPGPQETDPL